MMYEFHVVSGEKVVEIITQHRHEIVAAVEETYLAHGNSECVNPDSYFLRFPQKPGSRIIALPAFLGERTGIAGIKWVSSFPENIERNIPRASAALLLNDYSTGYPLALLEASEISAARTAASAALAARVLTGSQNAHTLGIVGAGIISRTVLEFLAAEGWKFRRILVHDLEPRYSAMLSSYAHASLKFPDCRAAGIEQVLRDADVVLLATTAAAPHITDTGCFTAGQTILNISLRDLSPDIIALSHNVLDDVDHCLKASTSPHLAEQKYGNRSFIAGTLAQVMRGAVEARADKPVIFSPFGLGVLDLAVGLLVYREAMASGAAVQIPGFFGTTARW
jgi:2,3-diaminopropionate biosynthesis protein SbnB